jgi:serine/threonine protein kinase
MADGCIAKMLKRFGPFPEENVKNYLRQILSGLNYLHKNKIIHRDIKGGNILVKDAVAKLADFGCSLQFKGDASVEPGTLHRIHGSVPWMAPEMIRQSSPGRKVNLKLYHLLH